MADLIRCLTTDATVMAMAVDATDIVAQAEQYHKTSAVVTAALGRTLTAASMMGVMLKNTEDTITIKLEGNGPIGSVTAVSDGKGNARGYASNPIVEIPLRPDGKLDVGNAIGKEGILSIAKDTGGKEPYTGSVPLVSGEIAEDITSYYAVSEQTPTVCALGVLVNPDLTVKSAGGILLQLLPFCPEDVIARIENNVKKLPSVTQMLTDGFSPNDMVKAILDGFEFNIIDQYKPEYKCTCSREKFNKILTTLSEEDKESLPNEEGLIEVICRFCNTSYKFTKNDIKK